MNKITQVDARRILDSRGEWTIEVSLVFSIAGTMERRVCVSVPSGKSIGRYEAHTLAPEQAIAVIRERIAPMLVGKDPEHYFELEQAVLALDASPGKREIGANTALGVSLVLARAVSAVLGIELWQFVAGIASSDGIAPTAKMPKLYANIINGGLHSQSNLDFQEYIIIPQTDDIHEAVTIILDIYRKSAELLGKKQRRGFVGIGDEGGLSANFAGPLEPFEILARASEATGHRENIRFGLDSAGSNVPRDANELKKTYHKMVEVFNLAYLEDPFDEEDVAEFAHIKAETNKTMRTCGDDLTTTNVERMKQAKEADAIDCVIVKPNQIGSLTETLSAVKYAREQGWDVVVSHRSGETNDAFIADIAYGLGADGFKLGSPVRGERVAKYNRLFEIVRNAKNHGNNQGIRS